jgi:hypothetical protein
MRNGGGETAGKEGREEEEKGEEGRGGEERGGEKDMVVVSVLSSRTLHRALSSS